VHDVDVERRAVRAQSSSLRSRDHVNLARINGYERSAS